MPCPGETLVNCQNCDAPLEEGKAFCSSCGTQVRPGAEAQPDVSVQVLLMAGIGGLLAFFGFSFGLVAAVAETGFLTLALVTCCIALALFILAYFSRRSQLADWRKREAEASSSARCSYCGFRNPRGSRKCESCGAPL